MVVLDLPVLDPPDAPAQRNEAVLGLGEENPGRLVQRKHVGYLFGREIGEDSAGDGDLRKYEKGGSLGVLDKERELFVNDWLNLELVVFDELTHFLRGALDLLLYFIAVFVLLNDLLLALYLSLKTADHLQIALPLLPRLQHTAF